MINLVHQLFKSAVLSKEAVYVVFVEFQIIVKSADFIRKR